MESIISGIRHFLVTTFVTIATIVTAVLPSNKPLAYPTPTPEMPMSCAVGKFSLDLLKNHCDKLQSYINGQRTRDSVVIQQLLKSLNESIQRRVKDLNFLKNKADEVNNLIAEQKKSGRYTFEQWSADLRAAQILLTATKDSLDAKYKLEQQRDFYLNYLDKIQFGGIGSGACSSHEGVDCSTPRGNIGQVICVDGWDQSQVYYFNVRECVEYTESTLTQ